MTAISTPKKASVTFWTQGEPFVWATAAALAGCLLMIVALLIVVVYNGGGVFWPHTVVQVDLKDDGKLLGEYKETVQNPDTKVFEEQYKVGNRELRGGEDFVWVMQENIAGRTTPEDVVVLERMEDGNFYGFLEGVRAPNLRGISGDTPIEKLADAMARQQARVGEEVDSITDKTADLSARLQNTENDILYLKYRRDQLIYREGGGTAEERQEINRELERLHAAKEELKQQSDRLVERQDKIEAELKKNVGIFKTVGGQAMELPLHEIVRFYQPNKMGTLAKVGHYGSKCVELLTDRPRESNTEGGLFPAIFGTVMLIFLMALTSFPLGVLAGIYLREYAKDGILVRLVRIAVNNLAGIPSIVYGIFGLGFFVYQFGGLVDSTFFPHLEEVNRTVYNTGGILWASMTLGILTVPVVIVSVEEALGAIPMGVREGSLALGATKFQTLWRVLLPMASPGILTGFILAMARAAGEVAPLMITGVVKMAPTLPVDGTFPYLHLDRKFMHLGFHIYDIGFQSPNVEAAKPMVYVTTFLLLMIVLVMTSLAIVMRNRMRKRYEIRSI